MGNPLVGGMSADQLASHTEEQLLCLHEQVLWQRHTLVWTLRSGVLEVCRIHQVNYAKEMIAAKEI